MNCLTYNSKKDICKNCELLREDERILSSCFINLEGKRNVSRDLINISLEKEIALDLIVGTYWDFFKEGRLGQIPDVLVYDKIALQKTKEFYLTVFEVLQQQPWRGCEHQNARH